VYSYVYSFAYLLGAGYLTLNRGRKSIRRTSHGNEDGIGSTRT
jgi:hypothetical protein